MEGEMTLDLSVLYAQERLAMHGPHELEWMKSRRAVLEARKGRGLERHEAIELDRLNRDLRVRDRDEALIRHLNERLLKEDAESAVAMAIAASKGQK